MVPLLTIAALAVFLVLAIVFAVWNVFYILNMDWLTALRQSSIGEMVLSALLLAAVYFGARAVWRGLRRLNAIAARLADRASLQRRDLEGRPGGRMSRTVFVLGAIYLSGILGVLTIDFATSNWNALGSFLYRIDSWNWVGIYVLIFSAPSIAVSAWHWWTLRRVARALERLDASTEPQARADMKVVAA